MKKHPLAIQFVYTYSFSPVEKVEVLKCLMNQILTYSASRDVIEEGCDKAKQLKVELRSLQAEQTRKEKEEAIRFELFLDTSNANCITLFKAWKSMEYSPFMLNL